EPGSPPPPSPFTDALRGGEEAASRGDVAAAEHAWNSAYEMFPDYDGKNAPLDQLVKLYKKFGDDAKYRAALERLLYSSPQELDAGLALTAEYQKLQQWDKVALTADWVLGI